MGFLDRVLTPRGAKRPSLPPLALPLSDTHQPAVSPSADENVNITQIPHGRTSRLGKLVSAAGRILTPRTGRRGASGSSSSAVLEAAALASPRIHTFRRISDAQRTAARHQALSDGQLRLSVSPGATSTGPRRPLSGIDDAADSDTTSLADSEASSLDGFGDYARVLGSTPAAADSESSGVSTASASSPAGPDNLPSPRLLIAPVQNCPSQQSARNSKRAEEDLQHFLQAGELPASEQRLVGLLAYADRQGPDAFEGLPLHSLGFERCAALLLQLLQPLPPSSRLAALVQLQAKLSAELLTYLGSSLERVLESERGCQRFCRLPFEVVRWLLEYGPADRGETLFDLANLWLEQQPKHRRAVASEAQQAELASLIWRRPLAADFLSCMEANLAWAEHHVARCRLRPARLPPTLDGRFSFTAEFELHDLIELQQAAVAAGRPQQQHSPAMYCGGYCWWAVLVANPVHNRFELYASCAPFSLFLEPYRAALQPPADLRFSFQGNTSLAEWRQSNGERVSACHTHWGGPAFWVPPSCPSLLVGSSSSGELRRSSSGGVGSHGGRNPPAGPMAAAARPDTARGPRPSSRLSMPGSVRADAATPPGLPLGPSAGHRRSLSGAASSAQPPQQPSSSCGSLGSSSSHRQQAQAQQAQPHEGSGGGRNGGSSSCGYDANSGAVTARHLQPSTAGLRQLSMDQLVAEVRRSCPYAWGASLRVRLNLIMRGGGASSCSST